ncbi:RNA polymerase sigma factor [Gorillibacterium sp. sgz500922]|uniref:RNA polymerase sigma factor n=1 Tax=Gorillibacterium sp. sgz500922 TaxID=3446694 RepID=UPI003F6706AE
MANDPWFSHLQADLRRFARSLARHEQEAHDLVQEALVKALGFPELADWPDYKQKAWFYRVMKNRLIDERRKDHRLTAWEEQEPEGPLIAPVQDPVETADLLARLPRELSDIVFKRYWLDLSSQEIGAQLGLPAATVRYKLQQAIRQLRKIMEAN